jgi:hypothetical protein
MEAYLFKPNYAEIMTASVDRHPLDYPEFDQFIADGGSTKPMSASMFKYWPTKAFIETQATKVTNWILASGYTVSRDVKIAIEELEPNKHQFVPLSLQVGTHIEYRAYQYFSLHITQRIDDIDEEKSDVRWRTIQLKAGGEIRAWSKKTAPLVLPAASVTGKHLWWNKAAHSTLMSGELYRRLKDNGLTSGLKFQQQIVE